MFINNYLKSIMIPIEKKKDVARCEDSQNHQLNILCFKSFATGCEKANREESRGRDLCGYRVKKGRIHAIGVLLFLVEKSIEFNQDLYVCFVDNT